MQDKNTILVALALTLLLVVSFAPAQSLGDFARAQRQQRSKEARKPVKVYTNENLPTRPPEEGPTAAAGVAAPSAEVSSGGKAESGAQPAQAGAAEPKVQSKPPQAVGEKPEDKKKTKDYWQDKFKSARDQLARAEEEQRLAEDERSLLQIQQARELNPEAVNEIGGKITAKMAEVDTKRAATAKARKALEDLENEFKESGAPEDWGKTE